MLLSLLSWLFLGVVVGVLCGLAPGLHPNLVSVLLIAFIPALEPVSAVVFIVSVSVVNTIVNFIPAVFVGLPDSGNELSLLPSHSMLSRGLGYQAVKLCVYGSFFSLIALLIMTPFIVLATPAIYAIIEPRMALLLIAISAAVILTDKNKLGALFLFALAGCLGLVASRLPINPDMLLFPLLTGLFGISMLLLAVKNKTSIPEQDPETPVVGSYKLPVAAGTLGGMATGMLPGVGASEAALVTSFGSESGFLASVGAITMANTVFSFMALWLIGKGRSGAAVAVKHFAEVSPALVVLMLLTALISCCIAVLLTLKISSVFLKQLSRINYSLLSLVVLGITVLLIFVLTGWYGIALAGVASLLGLIPNLTRIRRMNLMACLIVPAILFFLGFSL